MNNQFEFVKFTAAVFERIGAPYFITGSIASMYYGEIRTTNDVDVVADLRLEHISALRTGFPAPDFYLDEDAIRDAIQNHFQFNIIHWLSGLKVDVIQFQGTEFDNSRLNRVRRAAPSDVLDAWVASPEDVIIKKLVYHSEGGGDKHLRDISGMLRISGAVIDRDYILQWADKLGVRAMWDLVLKRESQAP